MSTPTDGPLTVRARTYSWIQPLAMMSRGPDPVDSQPSAETQPCWIQNLSLAGVVVICNDKQDTATRLLVELRAAAQNRSLKRAAWVESSARLPSGRWLVACEFAPPLSEEDVTALR